MLQSARSGCSLAACCRPAIRHIQAAVPHAISTSIATSQQRGFQTSPAVSQIQEDAPDRSHIIAKFCNSIQFPKATHRIADLRTLDATNDETETVVLQGYVYSQRNASSKLVFVELVSDDGQYSVQLKLHSSADSARTRDHLRLIRPFAPIAVVGRIEPRKAPARTKVTEDGPTNNGPTKIDNVEVNIDQIYELNEFPKDIIVSHGTVVPQEQRHLQLRTSKVLRDAVNFRSRATDLIRSYLSKHRFADIETPLLFKSTPEGAHEFLVPTRDPGHAYALPQSPQQYKQILMASGVPRYMQIAKCFRDEDLRADRQPEFTQVDIEMAFAGESEVMEVIEGLIKTMWRVLLNVDLGKADFPHMTYEEAMSKYGSDKPDTRLGMPISRLEYMLPIDLVGKISPLLEPAVEVFKIGVSTDPKETRRFMNDFMDSPDARPFMTNPHGQPGIFIYDSRKPLGGLQPFGFEAAEYIEEHLDLQEGDVVVLQARPNEPYTGGATAIGNLRLALHRAAVNANLLPKPEGWTFLWIKDFPLFSPSEEAESGTIGLESTHHPFTAPLPESADLLLTAPQDVKAAHYDLVLNGVEIGGGSRRIHQSEMQTLILKDILKLPPHRLAQFDHLIEVLRAGCPPHAGMALGLDRLLMLMLRRETIRDVIAFPKLGGGWDGLVQAPTLVDKDVWKRYHLAPIEKEEK